MIGIIKNAKEEGPGTIKDYLLKERIPYCIFESYDGIFPSNLEVYTGLIIMGGPMGVYEMKRYPFLKRESVLIEKAINKNMKVLGICLGAQLIAHTLGAKVYKGDVEEIGWSEIEITDEGLKDNLINSFSKDMSGRICRRFKVFQWHGDTFTLPTGAVNFARSPLYENQSFRFREDVYALQFHIEVNKGLLVRWFEEHPSKKQILKEYEELNPEYLWRSQSFYMSFFTS